MTICMGNTRNVVGSPDVLFDIRLIMRRRCQDLMLTKIKYFEKARTKIDTLKICQIFGVAALRMHFFLQKRKMP